jgi:hypothetical protein
MGSARLRLVGLLVLLIGSGPIQAEQRLANERSARDYAHMLEKQLKEAENHDCTSRGLVGFFRSWVFFVIFGAVVVTIGIVLKAAGWLYLHVSTTTDPEKLARGDPWVRAHLARQDQDPEADARA